MKVISGLLIHYYWTYGLKTECNDSQYIQMPVCQCKISKNLGNSSFTVHDIQNIIDWKNPRRFKCTRDMKWNYSWMDFQEVYYYTVLKSDAWDQEFLWQLLSLNTGIFIIHKCKIKMLKCKGTTVKTFMGVSSCKLIHVYKWKAVPPHRRWKVFLEIIDNTRSWLKAGTIRLFLSILSL